MQNSTTHDKGYAAFRLLQVTFVIAPIIAGLDKFFHLLVNWNIYLSPLASRLIGGHDTGFMMLVGIVEIIAGIGTIFKPKVFAFIIFAWLILIILNLLSIGHFYDIALRDLGLCLSAFALGLLAKKYS